MIQIDLATLVKRLNPFAKQALEMAASECMSQQASEITVAHAAPSTPVPSTTT